MQTSNINGVPAGKKDASRIHGCSSSRSVREVGFILSTSKQMDKTNFIHEINFCNFSSISTDITKQH